MAMSGHRMERLADAIRGILARVLREEMRDPRVGFVTITAVEVSADLRHARVFVSRLGNADEKAASVAALNRAASFLRRTLAREANLRRTPDLAFVEDSALKSGFRVEDLIDQIHRDQPPPGDGPVRGAGGE